MAVSGKSVNHLDLQGHTPPLILRAPLSKACPPRLDFLVSPEAAASGDSSSRSFCYMVKKGWKWIGRGG